MKRIDLRGNFSLRMLTENRQELYGVATLWILLFHACLCRLQYTGFWDVFLSYGNMGCEIFLFLSGICLYFSYHGNERYAPFIKRRLLRLYVPIVVICSWYWLYQLIAEGHCAADAFGLLISNWLTLSFWLFGDEQIWFISLLLICYLLYPCLYHLFFHGGHALRKLAVLLAVTVGLTLLLSCVNWEFYDRTLIALSRLPIFFIGCYFGRKVYRGDAFPRWILPVSVAVFGIVLWILNLQVLSGAGLRYTYLPGGMAVTFALAWLFHSVKWKPLHTVFRFFGNMSLELYLSNIILARLYRKTPFYHPQDPSMPHYFLLLAVTVIVAYGAYRLGKVITRRRSNG